MTLTYGEQQSIDVNLSDDQPYSPDVADDLAARAVKAMLEAWRGFLAEAKANELQAEELERGSGQQPA